MSLAVLSLQDSKDVFYHCYISYSTNTTSCYHALLFPFLSYPLLFFVLPMMNLSKSIDNMGYELMINNL